MALSRELARWNRLIDESIAATQRGDGPHPDDGLRLFALEQALHDALHPLKDRGELGLARDAGLVLEVIPQAAAWHRPGCRP